MKRTLTKEILFQMELNHIKKETLLRKKLKKIKGWLSVTKRDGVVMADML